MADQRTKAEAFRKLHNGPSILMLLEYAGIDNAAELVAKTRGFPRLELTDPPRIAGGA